MTSGPTDWHQALARVNGQLVHGEQRVTTHELLTVHLGVPVTDPACRRLRRVMRDLGWRGPRLMRWGRATVGTVPVPPGFSRVVGSSVGEAGSSRPCCASTPWGVCIVSRWRFADTGRAGARHTGRAGART